MAGGTGQAAPIASTGPSISTKELNRLKELTNKIPELEDMLNKILKDLKGLNLGELKDKLKELERMIGEKADKSEVDKALNDLRKRVQQLEDDVDFLKKNMGGGSGSGVDGDVIIQINNKIKNLEVKLDDLDKDLRK